MSERTIDLIRKDMQQAKNEAKKNILLPAREVEDVLALVDSLQQQVKELQEGNRSAVESREIAVRKARETCVTSNMHYAKVVELLEQLAERDRTIDLLTKDQALKPKKWTVVNTVYFNDDSNQIYGYKVKNEDNTMRRIISSKTANELTLKGQLIFSSRQELSFVSVDRNYIEKALGRE
ncbi:hypothetical protein [Paenibacillus polymyxa]|uniref:hypothetical protein n=1 Tax=Paenibacillus polymyxa TaxID=1406 RepID=UPI0002EA0EC7|nr:hypothetical protein [Paenibacillus polymyxa]NMP10563.1 hypothetical protein [Paenibacillus polymyxa]